MKFFSRFILIGLAVILFGALTFLLFPRASRQKTQQGTKTSQRIATHSHPHDTHSHPHPHVEPHDSLGQDTAAGAANTDGNGSQEQDGVGAHSMGIRSAFLSAAELWATDPELASAQLHAIAEELGAGDPQWTEFYHLLGHSIVSRPPGAPEDGAYLTLEDAKRFYLLKDELMGLSDEDKTYVKELQKALQWNQDGRQVGQQTRPIRELLDWMQENAPAEWETVNSHFWDTVWSRSTPPETFSDEWQTIGERTNIYYDTFFESLELLSEDSLTLAALYEGSRDVAQQTLSSEQTLIGISSPPIDDVPEAPVHTWDMQHETPIPVDAATIEDVVPSPNVLEKPAGSEPPIDFQDTARNPENFETLLESEFSPENFEKVMSTLRQYGSEEGMRRLRNENPRLASQIEKRLQSQNRSPAPRQSRSPASQE